jgi:hypothetical protein
MRHGAVAARIRHDHKLGAYDFAAVGGAGHD